MCAIYFLYILYIFFLPIRITSGIYEIILHLYLGALSYLANCNCTVVCLIDGRVDSVVKVLDC